MARPNRINTAVKTLISRVLSICSYFFSIVFSILFALLAMVVLVCILLFYDHLQKVRAAMFDALASVSYLGHSMTEGSQIISRDS